MSKMTKTILLCVIACVSSVAALAESKSFQASLTPGIAFYDRTQRIEGMTLSIWGENPQKSLALGFVNGTTGDSIGASLAFFCNYADSYKGVQLGMVNSSDLLNGVQFGLVNYTDDTKTGVQFGLVNIINSNKTWFSNFPKEIGPFMIFINWRLKD